MKTTSLLRLSCYFVLLRFWPERDGCLADSLIIAAPSARRTSKLYGRGGAHGHGALWQGYVKFMSRYFFDIVKKSKFQDFS